MLCYSSGSLFRALGLRNNYFRVHADAGIYFWLVWTATTHIRLELVTSQQFPAKVNAWVQPWFMQLNRLGIYIQNLLMVYTNMTMPGLAASHHCQWADST